MRSRIANSHLMLRRVIAAEYVVRWADQECEFYTHIVRLAALEYFGVAGSSMDNLTPEMHLPAHTTRDAATNLGVFKLEQRTTYLTKDAPGPLVTDRRRRTRRS